jgi:hypothetical protein
VQNSPRTTLNLFVLAFAHYRAGQYGEALLRLSEAGTLTDKPNPMVLILLGMTHFQRSDWDQAIKAMTQVGTSLENHVHLRPCRVDREVQLRQRRHPRAHQTARIDDDPDRLAPLDFIQPRDELAAARAGRPADVAEFVAWPMLAQAFERAARAESIAPADHVRLPAAHDGRPPLPSMFWIGDDAWPRSTHAHRSAIRSRV